MKKKLLNVLKFVQIYYTYLRTLNSNHLIIINIYVTLELDFKQYVKYKLFMVVKILRIQL